ncbi:hypothetical protein SODG_005805 [Sodalis praecaptivus]
MKTGTTAKPKNSASQPPQGVNPSEAGPSKMADEPALADAPSVSDAAAVDKDAGPNRRREALLALENDKVKGAVRTDFILSAEIIVISLNIVAQAPLLNQIAVMVLIALVMTLGVYGILAAIVKMDDLGLYMSRLTGQDASRALLRRVGAGIVSAAPLLMKTLSVVGTIAMFLVGGSILAHGFPWTHGLIDSIGEHYRGLIGTLVISLSDMLLGLITGTIVVLVVALIKNASVAGSGRGPDDPLADRDVAYDAGWSPPPDCILGAYALQVCCKRRLRRPRLPDAERGFAWFYGRNRLLRGADGFIPLAWNRRHSSSVVPRCLDVTAEGIVWFDRAAAAQISAK